MATYILQPIVLKFHILFIYHYNTNFVTSIIIITNTKEKIGYCNADSYKCPPSEQYTRYDMI